MIILVEDNLLHVDSSTDILEHYGVKGMKWGKRLRSAVESVKQAPKNIYNNHVENIKYSYRKKGLSEAEVEAKTKKRLRNEKIALAAAGTAIAAYAANKGVNYAQDEYLGRTFKKGTSLYTVGTQDKMDYGRHFYAAKGKDVTKYARLYSYQLKEAKGVTPGLIKTRLDKTAQVAGNSKAREEFYKLYKQDPDFKSKVHDIQNLYGKAKKMGRYESFNTYAPYVGVGDKNTNPWLKYTERMSKKGFAGIQDVNDKKFSGYYSKNPMIFFNVKGHQEGIKTLTPDGNKAVGVVAKTLAKKSAEATLPFVVGAAGAVAAGDHSENKEARLSDTSYQRKYKNTK